MIRIKRPAAAAGAAVLLAFSLTACGGGPGSDAPTDASEDEFCEGYTDAFGAVGGDDEESWEKFQDSVEEWAEIGTPEEISEGERNGFEVWVDAVLDTDYDGAKDAADPGDFGDISGDDTKDVTEFFTYANTTCIGEIPTDIPTDLGTDIPTDITTE